MNQQNRVALGFIQYEVLSRSIGPGKASTTIRIMPDDFYEKLQREAR